MAELSTPLAAAHERYGEAIAWFDGQEQYTYRELSAAVMRRAAQLRHAGLRPTERVAFLPQADFSTLCAFWAVVTCGAVACPISTRFPADKQAELVARLGARWLSDYGDRTGPAPTPEELLTDDQAPATVILSSGSTGEAKAIVHSWQAHVASAEGALRNMPLGVGDRWVWSLPAYHVGGLAILIRCAIAGATVVTTSPASSLSSVALAEQEITHLSVVDTQLRRLLDESNSFPAASLRAVLLGGSGAPRLLIARAQQRGVPLHTTYGLTEMASQVTTTSAEDLEPRLLTAGRVLPNRDVMISHDGEILVRGPTLCLGYDRGGEVHSVVDENGWFHTGDLGRLDDAGYLTVTGRRDIMFVSGGENIYPEAVERAILELPGVRRAIVVPRSDDEFGARPVAFVDVDSWKIDQWETFLREELRGFEIPVAFLPWPDLDDGAIKPSRAKLTSLAGTMTNDEIPNDEGMTNDEIPNDEGMTNA